MAAPNPKAKLGSGGRFAAFTDRLVAEGKSVAASKAIAASAGRKAHGAGQMAKWSKAGK